MMHKRSLNKVLVILAILIAATALLGKASIASDNATAAADFLNIGAGARSASMGGAYSSVASGADAAYWNPGGLTNMENAQVMFSHFSWYQDINYEYISLGYPVNDKMGLAVSASYLSYGSIEGYDSFDNPTGEIDGTFDMATGISFGAKLNENLSVGLTGKYIILSLDGDKSSAFAVDIGSQYQMGKFSFGLVLANLGSNIDFGNSAEKLPTALRGGISAKPFGNQFQAAIEIEHQFYNDLSISNGIEYIFDNRYFLRAGYEVTPSQDGRVWGQSPSLGVGAIMGPALFDYTFSPSEKYSSESIHRVTLQFSL